ncbi:sigma factor-like helix-turn-helix DNA-binding protein [Streptomyces sp. NPDC005963]|uniref:sigma factor-like helix-turn-helix DNA-binding protein n=1 Tax=Streptomyces sp. NPDC005963 TaxID=3156721 RepID=UPI0033F5C560
MSERRSALADRRVREFEAFTAGAAGRLLHAATLLTAETPDANPRAQHLLTSALARTYAQWDRLRGEDPYDCTRQELVHRFARGSWRRHRTGGGLLARLTPQERLVVVLQLYEGVAEEQTAALLGLSPERVRTDCRRVVAALCAERAAAKFPRPGDASGSSMESTS